MDFLCWALKARQQWHAPDSLIRKHSEKEASNLVPRVDSEPLIHGVPFVNKTITITSKVRLYCNNVSYQSIPAVNIPPGRPRGNFFEGAKSPPPRQKGCKITGPGAKIHVQKSSKAPPPGQNKTEEIYQRYTLKRHRNVLKMGISIKQNHLLKLKYSLHISETLFRIVLISIDTCITVVLQMYTLKLRGSYLIILKMYSPPPTAGLKMNGKN